ncbi:glycerate kinase type-2 family protein [Shimia ponticola]|uniref:glycerate kinase type-2 family protein n=1 Tax=Shimia ponticola TaxID=2582893 RepID=UPI0021024310|nr:DUF4147 domain-containing protein [Shimia ponticola]
MRAFAQEIFGAGVAAADPFNAVTQALQARPPEPGAPIIAVGKAAMRMVEAALAFGSEPSATVVVTNPENARQMAGVEVFAASHPVPDAVGVEAAEAVEDILQAADAGTEVLCLISGGGSALLPAPADGLDLQDKISVNELLLGSGAEIDLMNAVRQQLSRLKGGGMLRAAAPARVRALILSDVVGDDLRAIASGPTVAPLTDASGACAILSDLGLWDRVPERVRAHLQSQRETDRPLPEAENILVGSNALSVAAMAKQAGGQAIVHEEPLVGDVGDAAARIAAVTTPGVHLFGGETTVVLTGSGKGGRNQELALRVAMALQGQTGWVFLQGGSDGRDGPTDAAGGIVDGGTVDRIRAAGGDPEALLANNDAYAALTLAGDLLMTGGTGTNVADLGVLIRT